MHTLVLMRHGESTANLDGTFAGWLDVPLTAVGIAQCRSAGHLLRDAAVDIDLCYTSVLKLHPLRLALPGRDGAYLASSGTLLAVE